MTNPDPQAIWNQAIIVALNVCRNLINIYSDGGNDKEVEAAEKCRREIAKYFNDPYHIKVLMGTEPPEDKGPV